MSKSEWRFANLKIIEKYEQMLPRLRCRYGYLLNLYIAVAIVVADRNLGLCHDMAFQLS